MATSELINHTTRFWQKRNGAPVSSEEARQMVENASGFFTLLGQWAAAERHPKTGYFTDDEESRG